MCIRIAFLLEHIHGQLHLERGFEVVSSGLQVLTFLVRWIPTLNNSFLGMNWAWMSYSSHVICEAACLQCFLMRCPETQGTVACLMAMATQVGAGGWQWQQVPGVLGAAGAPTIHAGTSFRAGINATWPPSRGATHGVYSTISVCKGAAGEAARAGWQALPAWADIQQCSECSPDEPRCWGACAPDEAVIRSWKLEGKLCFLLAIRNGRDKSRILLTQL